MSFLELIENNSKRKIEFANNLYIKGKSFNNMIIHDFGDGMTATYYPAVRATSRRCGTFAHYKYYAKKSRKYTTETSYQELYEWIRTVCEEIRSSFESHYKSETNKEIKFGLMFHPNSQKNIKQVRTLGSINNVRITMVFSAQTDVFYVSPKFSHLIHAYFYQDELRGNNVDNHRRQ